MAAATYDLSAGGTTQLNPNGQHSQVLERTIDFSKITAIANGESATIFNLPAGCQVKWVSCAFSTVEDTGDKIDIGDTDTHGAYIAVGAADATTLMFSGNGTDGTGTYTDAAKQFVYRTAKDIRITAHTGSFAIGKATFKAEIVLL